MEVHIHVPQSKFLSSQEILGQGGHGFYLDRDPCGHSDHFSGLGNFYVNFQSCMSQDEQVCLRREFGLDWQSCLLVGSG